jgi:Gpi18-like mannosyltransferase
MLRIFRREKIIFLILAVAAVMRMYDLTHAGYLGDMMLYNVPWARAIQQYGLFRVYANSPDINYPPIYLAILGISSSIISPTQGKPFPLDFIVCVKLFSVAAELAIIVLIYNWLPKGKRLTWMIPLALALHPGLIATSAFWGQTDSILTLLLILTVIALTRNQPVKSWIWFSLAVLMKFQAVVVLPMLGILSIRRFGLRSTAQGILIASAIFGSVMAPFVIFSGPIDALRPFIGATDRYPVVTVNAFNLWYLVIPPLWNLLPTHPSAIPFDTNLIIGSLNIRQVGLILFASDVLLIVIVMWRQRFAGHEFIWITALYVGFFMLPTQMHERYLYPAAVFALIAIVQDRRVWTIACMLMFSYTVNVVVVPDVDYYWFGMNLKALLSGMGLAAVSLNLLALAGITLLSVHGSNRDTSLETNNHSRLKIG